MPSNVDHAKILTEFRKQVESEGILKAGDTIGTDDYTLLRFLKARDFDIKNAKSMLEKCQHWRKTVEGVGLDTLYDEIDPFDYPERDTVFKYWPLWFHKTDKEGRPINIQLFGQMNATALFKEVPRDRQWKAFCTNCEVMTREILPACSKARGERVGDAYCIIDLKGFGLSQFWSIKGLVRDSFKISQDYYPETMGHVTVINAPATFAIIWNAIKPWLAPATVKKIDIQGSDYQAALLRDIDADNLPSFLGGNCTCGGGKEGCKGVDSGPWLDGRVYHGHGPSKYRSTKEDTLVNTTPVQNPIALSEKTAVISQADIPEPRLPAEDVL
ncbi:hypothetical protein M422DRAFT_24710 [Sphaerobolus stellatus SS14]|nr:hypothetical protein M422DRAFT_24710 [Sphaerobolus stellatus SS14]